MTTIFQRFIDKIAYMNNVLLATKSSFEQHVQRLEQVLTIQRLNNLYVHVEDTYLAS